MVTNQTKNVSRYPGNEPNTPNKIAKDLTFFFPDDLSPNNLVIICIGTDRATGDALGPIVGSHLIKSYPSGKIYGTLDKPVHATNLHSTISEIHNSSYILAVDASLGKTEHVGKISIRQGPLLPGAGVNKNLPQIGDWHITGIVNVGGFLEYLVLQNTKLSTVFTIAEAISNGIEKAINLRSLDPYKKNKPSRLV